MNAAQIHLALTHMPVVLTLTGLAILSVSLFIKNKTVSSVSYFVLIAAGLFALPVFFSGEGAEEIVEELTGVTGSMIEEHEEFAQLSLYAILLTAVISIFALLRLGAKLAKPLTYLVLVCAVGATGLMIKTAHLGGQIRHTEISQVAISGESNKNHDPDALHTRFPKFLDDIREFERPENKESTERH